MSAEQPMVAHRLTVAPHARGGWVLFGDHEVPVSEYSTATDAASAAREQLCDGGELVVYDRYHRSHRMVIGDAISRGVAAKPA